MWRSREIYANKLAESFPDDPDLARFYVRDLIAPRFFRTGIEEYKRHLARGRLDLCLKALAVAKKHAFACNVPAGRGVRRKLILMLMEYPKLFGLIYRLLRADPRFH